jgi:hypothetical protein
MSVLAIAIISGCGLLALLFVFRAISGARLYREMREFAMSEDDALVASLHPLKQSELSPRLHWLEATVAEAPRGGRRESA